MKRNVPTKIKIEKRKEKRKRRKNHHAEVARKRKSVQSEYFAHVPKYLGAALAWSDTERTNFESIFLPISDQKKGNEVDLAARRRNAVARVVRTKK